MNSVNTIDNEGGGCLRWSLLLIIVIFLGLMFVVSLCSKSYAYKQQTEITK